MKFYNQSHKWFQDGRDFKKLVKKLLQNHKITNKFLKFYTNDEKKCIQQKV